MLKEHTRTFRSLLMAADAALAVLAIVAAHELVRHHSHLLHLRGYKWFMPWFAIVWVACFQEAGLYEPIRAKRIPEMLRMVPKAAIMVVLIFGTLLYSLKAGDMSRLFIGTSLLFAGIFLSLERVVLMLWFRYWRRKGYNYRNMLIVGTGERAHRFIERIQRHTEWGFKIVGVIDREPASFGSKVLGHPVIGTLEDIPEIVHSHVVDEVVFAVPRSWLYGIEEAIKFCEVEGLRVTAAVDFFDVKMSRARQSDFEGMPLLSFESAPNGFVELGVKRLLDLVVSSVGLAVLAPVLVVIAVVVKVTSRGPMLFTQERCGLNGRRFKMIKFRTMVVDAEAQLPRLLQHNEMDGPVFKMTKDPRITAVGRFLRKTSLDELPQLWNVLCGHMSLVGPRPPLPREVARYDNWQRRKLSMRPGVTCLWQVNGRNRIRNFNDWVQLDLQYIDNWSLVLDWKILAKTVPTVVFGSGAK